MDREELKYWLALKSIEGIGPEFIQALLLRFSPLSAVFKASRAAVESIPGIKKKTAAAILSFKEWDKISRQLDALEKAGIQVITFCDDLYPAGLRNIYGSPPFLYVLGSLQKEDINLAIVGSRQASTYGRYTTERFSRELAQKGVTIVSGMARGIDTCSHRGALSAGGRTIAVLGSGPDVVYPPENKKLFSAICQNGAVISEYPPGTEPLPYHFPARNRIISGMSYGVLVVEAGEKSGSLITARLALEQGREVFAIPGSIDSPASRGTNSLIKQGAKLIENVDDIIEDIVPQLEPKASGQIKAASFPPSAFAAKQLNASFDGPNAAQKDIAEIIAQGKAHADDIISAVGLPAQEVLSKLMTLELQGIIARQPGNYYSLKK
jgi:DNA processing protein